MERPLADLRVLTKTVFEGFVENCLIKWSNTLQLQIVKDVESTFKDALQARYFNTNNDLKSAIFKVLEQVLGEVVRSSRAPGESEARGAASSKPKL